MTQTQADVENLENPTGKSFSSSEKVDFIDPNKMTKVIVHGWRNDHNSEMPQNLMKAYLENHDVNIVIVGWGYYSSTLNYLYAVKAKSLVARRIAEFILTNLHTDQVELNVHFIGHSLGAQVSADVGYLFRANGRHVYRITGLDPAHPFINRGLNYDHAFFVDIIRTTAGTLSAWAPSGHADFYPNGGKIPQPCCTGILPMCSHSAAWKYYLDTITNQTRYRAHKCNSYQSYIFGYCTIKTYMGEGANVEIRGTFYLDTEV
ncbi:lipase [Holotrichia oblita]|uniref:Lipase n=1 Tax=Holotrichia oblita TaxID=644536 RepID=A0ACB9TPT3_HOLOL|nr:lipase [Holotrichia oblita]